MSNKSLSFESIIDGFMLHCIKEGDYNQLKTPIYHIEGPNSRAIIEYELICPEGCIDMSILFNIDELGSKLEFNIADFNNSNNYMKGVIVPINSIETLAFDLDNFLRLSLGDNYDKGKNKQRYISLAIDLLKYLDNNVKG